MRTEKLSTDVRQEQILEAALDVVAARGMKGLSIGAVARRVGLVPSAIYRHFPSKEAVVDGVLELVQSRLAASIAGARDESENALDALEHLLKKHLQLVRKDMGIPLVVFSEEVFGSSARRKKRIYRLMSTYVRGVAALFEEAQRAGQIIEVAEPQELAVMFLGLLQPAAILWVVSGGDFDVTRQVDRSWQVFRKAIAT